MLLKGREFRLVRHLAQVVSLQILVGDMPPSHPTWNCSANASELAANTFPRAAADQADRRSAIFSVGIRTTVLQHRYWKASSGGLRTEAPQDDAEWQAQTDLVQACLAEMVEMSEPTVNPSKGATSRYVHRPVADELRTQLAKANRAECLSAVASGSLRDDSLTPGSSVNCVPASGPA